MTEAEEGEIFDDKDIEYACSSKKGRCSSYQKTENVVCSEKKFWSSMKEIFGVAPSKSPLRDEPHSYYSFKKAACRNAKSRGTRPYNKVNRCFPSNRGHHNTFQRGGSSKKKNNKRLASQSRSFETSYEKFTEGLPENQPVAPEEHDLNELQLRLDALKTSIQSMNQSWRQPLLYTNVSDAQNAYFYPNQGASRNFADPNLLSDANNTYDISAFDAQFSTSVHRHDVDFPVAQWHEEQQRRILQLQDPRAEISSKYLSDQFTSPSSVSGNISRPLRPFLLPYPEVAGSYGQPILDQSCNLRRDDDYSVKNMEFSSDSEKEVRVDIPVWKPNSSFSEEFTIRPSSFQSYSQFAPSEQRRLYAPDENSPLPPTSASAQSKVFPSDAYSTSSDYSYSPLLTGKADAADYIFIERNIFGDIDLRRPVLLPPPEPPSSKFADQCYEKESSRSSGATSASLDDIISSKSEGNDDERTLDGNVLENVSPAFSVNNERIEKENDDDDDEEASALREILLKSLENKKKKSFQTTVLLTAAQYSVLPDQTSNAHLPSKRRKKCDDVISTNSNSASPSSSHFVEAEMSYIDIDKNVSDPKLDVSTTFSSCDTTKKLLGSDLVVTIRTANEDDNQCLIKPNNCSDSPKASYIQPLMSLQLDTTKFINSPKFRQNNPHLSTIKKTITNVVSVEPKKEMTKFPNLQCTIANEKAMGANSKKNGSPFSIDRRNLPPNRPPIKSLADNLEPVIIRLDEDSSSDEDNNLSSLNADDLRPDTDASYTVVDYNNVENSLAKRTSDEAVLDKQAVIDLIQERVKECRLDMLKNRSILAEDRKRLKTLVSSSFKRKDDLRLSEKKLQELKRETKQLDTKCAEMRAFILRVNREIQNVQCRVDRHLEMQIIYEKQWNEIESLLPKKPKKIRNMSTKKRKSSSKSASSSVISSNEPQNMFFGQTASNSDVLQSEEQSCEEESFEESPNLESSPLMRFRNYRFTEDYLERFDHLLSSTLYLNKIEPNKIFCPYSLSGSCFDADCEWQHECDYNLSEVESIAEILAYCPALINYQSNGEYIINCARLLYDRLKSCMSQQEILEECARQIIESRRIDVTSVLDTPFWRPTQITVAAEHRNAFDFGNFASLSFSSDDHPPDLLESNETQERYFSVDFYEEQVKLEPSNAKLWIQWSRATLNSNGRDSVVQSLKILCDGLEKNRSNADLWIAYFDLYRFQPDLDKKPSLALVILSALNFAPCFQLSWLYWDQIEKMLKGKFSNDVENSTFRENVEQIFKKCIEFLINEQNMSASRTIDGTRSFKIFCCILRLVHYYTQTGQVEKAIDIIRNFVEDETYFDALSTYHCTLLCCVDLTLHCVDTLPADVQDIVRNALSTNYEISLRHFVVDWVKVSRQKLTSSDEILSAIDKYLHKVCSKKEKYLKYQQNTDREGSVANSSENIINSTDNNNNANYSNIYNENRSMLIKTWLLRLNRISLTVYLGRSHEALIYCDKIATEAGLQRNPIHEFSVIYQYLKNVDC